jgi:hypothetical protein
MKDYLAAVRRLPPSKQESVLAGRQALIDSIEAANNLDWLPISANLELTDAIFHGLGDEQADAFYQNWLKRQMSAPAFSGLVRTALALFRFDTASIAKWIPKAFDLMYRDYGMFAIEPVSSLQVNVELSKMPAELLLHHNWHRSVCSGLYALFFLTGVKGTAELASVDTARRTMRIALRWTNA